MIIDAIETTLLRRAVCSGGAARQAAVPVKTLLLVLIRCDNGQTGVGEAWVEAASPELLRRFVQDDVAPLFLGCDLNACEGAFGRLERLSLFSARHGLGLTAASAIDQALLDLRAKQSGQSVACLLGGTPRKIPACASGGWYAEGKTVEDLGEEIKAYRALGFRSFKIKIGGTGLEEDVARVAHVRQVIGAEAELILDGRLNLDIESILRLWPRIERFAIACVESPFDPEAEDCWQILRRQCSVPLSGPKLLRHTIWAQRLVTSGLIDHLVLDPLLCGRMEAFRALARLGTHAGLPVTLHHSNSMLSLIVNLNLAYCLTGRVTVESHMLHWQHLTEYAHPAVTLDNGCWIPRDVPGWGLNLASEPQLAGALSPSPAASQKATNQGGPSHVPTP